MILQLGIIAPYQVVKVLSYPGVVLDKSSKVMRGLLVAVERCNTQVRLSLIYVSANLIDLRYLGSL